MKALILAAGYGTRLLPYSNITPKALFTYSGRPLLDIIIYKLKNAGCQSIIINTHHLHLELEAFFSRNSYPIPITTRYEPEILGTAGAIKNVADFWDKAPFMVINCDIVTDINLKDVYDAHLKHDHPVTLVLYDDKTFNTVCLDKKGFVTGFCEQTPSSMSFNTRPAGMKHPAPQNTRMMTYTGIQVLDPEILDLIPDNAFSSCIDLYKKLLSENRKIYAFTAPANYWKDIGTPERYKESVVNKMAPQAFDIAFPDGTDKHITHKKLKGDGSDRNWYRLTAGHRSLVMVDHGIKAQATTSEADAFIAIGNHLHAKGIPTPKIYLHDAFSGIAFLEDLGDVNLQAVVQKAEDYDIILKHYQSVIILLLKLFTKGIEGFDSAWAYQTPVYNQEVILDKECAYFVDAFLRIYLGMHKTFADFEHEFTSIADRAVEFSVFGFMHRDLQSRNIMVKNNRFFFIDFQGGRRGPIQYDLASLLIDPYASLPHAVQNQLLEYTIKTMSTIMFIDPQQFRLGYTYCALARNLQILGAFGHLSRVKGKKYFEKYIPRAIDTLLQTLDGLENDEFPKLTSLARKIGSA